MKNQININGETCTKCGLCGEVCPNLIMKVNHETGILLRNDRFELCIRCGQCMAVCPSRSIQVSGLNYETDFFELPKGNVANLPFVDMIKTRRSIRAYKDQPVSREVLEQIVEAISFAPPSFTPLKVELVVIQDTAVMRRALPEMIKVYDGLLKGIRNPIGRIVIRLKNGDERFKVVQQHVVPMMKSRLPGLKQGKEDTITRNAPAMIVFHAHRDSENYETDINIALTFGLLAAHALGLGGAPIDLVPPAIQRNPVLREMFSIPADNIPVAALILGYPRFRFQRGIKRDLKHVTWLSDSSLV